MALTRNDIVQRVADDLELSKAQVDDVVRSYENNLKEAVANGDDVRLSDVGKFSITHRAARQGRNPQTGEPVQIKASSSPKFSAAKAFKELVNK